MNETLPGHTLCSLSPPAGGNTMSDDEPATKGFVREELANLAARFDQRFEQHDQRFEQIDQRFAQVDQRFEQIDQRFAQVDQRFASLEQRIDERFASSEQRTDEKLAGLEQRFDHKLELWAGAILARLDTQFDAFREDMRAAMAADRERLRADIDGDLARHVRASEEANRSQIRIVDDKYTDLPPRVTRLENTVFPPAPKKRRAQRR